MQELMIIDGYNIIYAWPEFAEYKEQELAHARDKLIDWMGEYGKLKNRKVVIVFDAHAVKGRGEIVELHGEVEVIFTAEGQTADSWIERAVHRLSVTGQRVYVATGDYAEQMLVTGKGGLRVTAKELHRELLEEKKSAEKFLHGYKGKLQTSSMEEQLDRGVRERLDALRKRCR